MLASSFSSLSVLRRFHTSRSLNRSRKSDVHVNRYGMERFKPAAGRIATTYYKRGALQRLAKSKADIESQDSEMELPSTEKTGDDKKVLSHTRSPNFLPSGNTFLWRHLSLDFKRGAQDRRLLDNVTGEFQIPGAESWDRN